MTVSRPRSLLLPGGFALTALLILLGLGTWQFERKAWKEALIATLAERLNAPPVELPPSSQWPAITAENSEFLRVRLRVERSGEKDALVYTSGSALRDDVKAPGYFVFAPVRMPAAGTIVIDRGYVPDQTYPGLTGPQDIVGVLRWPETSSWFVADHDAAGTVWYVRDPRAMARVKGWGTVAPFYIEQEAPVPPGGLPHPARLQVRLRNDHLQYAITWYGLAAVLVVMSAIFVMRRQREPSAAP
jgi:cytochrome oxidase assembly protein ShyY1